jgi:hypothetical protein
MFAKLGLSVFIPFVFFAGPSSSSYNLKSYDFSTGGGESSSASYKQNSNSGSSAAKLSSTSYGIYTGLTPNTNTNEPTAATVTNPSSYYDRLKITVNTAGNSAAAKYLIAISPDSFTTTYYVQTDNSMASALSIANYQTYASWGSASGFTVTGLNPNTTYSVKVKTLQGNFSESAYSPVATAATVLPTLSFSLTTSLTPTPPYNSTFSALNPGTVTTSDADAIIGLSTNSLNGGSVYVKSNGGLASVLAGYTITSASADLSVTPAGYGAQVTSSGQTTGGPLTAAAPYNGTTSVVGALSANLQQILSTPAAISGGTANIQLKSKSSFDTPASTDYTDRLTFVASMNY